MVWHNTAWFDECQFSWSVINDSSNLFGMYLVYFGPGDITSPQLQV